VPLSGEELETRFLHEAGVAARINHPGVVTVHDAGREGNSLYLVMELVEGESLSDRLARRRFPSAPEARAPGGAAGHPGRGRAGSRSGSGARPQKPPAGEVLSGRAVPTPERAAAAPAAPASRGQLAAAPAATTVAAPAVAAAPTLRSRPTPPIEKIYGCRAGAFFGVNPEEALITVNGKTIGIADDWDDAGGGQKYHFGGPRTYDVKLSLEQHRTAWIKIVARPQADEEYARLDLELKRLADLDRASPTPSGAAP
jgi:hypothetical protein